MENCQLFEANGAVTLKFMKKSISCDSFYAKKPSAFQFSNIENSKQNIFVANDSCNDDRSLLTYSQLVILRKMAHRGRVFATLKDALHFWNQNLYEFKDRPLLLAYELRNAHGARHYLISDFARFAHFYFDIPFDERCFYEVVPDDTKCRLYLDVEFDRRSNVQLKSRFSDTDIILCLIKYVCDELQETFTDNCLNIDANDVIDLESSTDDKFSHHLIFHCDGSSADKGQAKCFANNLQAGVFMLKIYRKLCNMSELELVDRRLDCLLVNSKESGCFKKVFICDLGVYSKNRNFRIFLSTKSGKNNSLMGTELNGWFYAKRSKLHFNITDILKDSLLTYLPSECEVLPLLTSYSTEKVSSICSTAVSSGIFKPLMCGNDRSSPYPFVDEHILNVIRQLRPDAFLRKWIQTDEHHLLFDVDNYKFCNRIGREHKSNHVYFVVDLQQKVYYQKCHDPDCKAVDFKSNFFALDRQLCELIDEVDMCQTASKIEKELYGMYVDVDKVKPQ